MQCQCGVLGSHSLHTMTIFSAVFCPVAMSNATDDQWAAQSVDKVSVYRNGWDAELLMSSGIYSTSECAHSLVPPKFYAGTS